MEDDILARDAESEFSVNPQFKRVRAEQLSPFSSELEDYDDEEEDRYREEQRQRDEEDKEDEEDEEDDEQPSIHTPIMRSPVRVGKKRSHFSSQLTPEEDINPRLASMRITTPIKRMKEAEASP